MVEALAEKARRVKRETQEQAEDAAALEEFERTGIARSPDRVTAIAYSQRAASHPALDAVFILPIRHHRELDS